jgi:hypothetical protein
MSGRITSVKRAVPFATLLATLLAARAAQAHRLDAQVFVLPNRKIQVESWFTSGGAAKGAKVQVFDAKERLLTEGHLSEQGVFVFSYTDIAPHTVIISAGAGHRRVLSIAPTALDRAETETNKASSAPVPLAERDSGDTVKDVLVGVGFLLAVAAFVLSLRNAQRLRTLATRANMDDKLS